VNEEIYARLPKTRAALEATFLRKAAENLSGRSAESIREARTAMLEAAKMLEDVAK
jgi:hypothetical protein